MNKELQKIMDFFGKSNIEGNVKSEHNIKILAYLQATKGESYDATLSKLAYMLTMSARQIRENYIKGLMYWGIIKTTSYGNDYSWEWVGYPALEKLKINLGSVQDRLEKMGKEKLEKQKPKQKE